MGLFDKLATRHPELKRKLRMAKIAKEPAEYVKRAFVGASYLAGLLTLSYWMFASGMDLPVWPVPFVGLIIFWLMYTMMLHVVDVKIRRMAKDIDREVLFAGRFLLVKLQSGRPLILALQEASKSYGVASRYFQEIVHDIDIGTPLEEALLKASRYSPSEKFRKIIFQISNALRIGVDVTHFLEAILDEISHEQLLEIQKYGKKLNSLTMFYMLFSIVVPSLGISLFITLISMISASINLTSFLVINFFIAVMEFFSITIFRSIRPTVNI